MMDCMLQVRRVIIEELSIGAGYFSSSSRLNSKDMHIHAGLKPLRFIHVQNIFVTLHLPLYLP